MIASALKGVISQRLVRRICPHCKEFYKPTEEELQLSGFDPADPSVREMTFARGRGCPECYRSGYRGRIVVVETLTLNKKIKHAIATRAPRLELLKAVEESGFEPMQENCRELVRQGITTTEEVRRVVFEADE